MSTALAPRAQAGVAGAGAGAQAGGGEARVVDRATLEAVCGEWSKVRGVGVPAGRSRIKATA
jgi:hypothetical protein